MNYIELTPEQMTEFGFTPREKEIYAQYIFMEQDLVSTSEKLGISKKTLMNVLSIIKTKIGNVQINPPIDNLLDRCRTKLQQDVIAEYLANGVQQTALKFGISERTVYRTIKIVKSYELENINPIGDLQDTSTLYRKTSEDGDVILEWVKKKVSREEELKLMHSIADGMLADIPKAIIPNFDYKSYSKDIIPWFQMGDAHIGVLTHRFETGRNFDLKIAAKELCKAIQVLIDQSPVCERCVIQDLGDFTHYENVGATTEASGHPLDYDVRYPKMIEVATTLMKYIVTYALEKYKFVDVIINQGNHSRTNDHWMSIFLRDHFSETDRVNVLDNSSVYIPYRMGNTFVMSHHGDKCRNLERLSAVMASKYAKDWGETKFHYIDIGHVHHKQILKESNGAIITSWNGMNPADKWAHDAGYMSRQFLNVVLRSRTYGNKGTLEVTAEEVRDILEQLEGYDQKEDMNSTVYTV